LFFNCGGGRRLLLPRGLGVDGVRCRGVNDSWRLKVPMLAGSTHVVPLLGWSGEGRWQSALSGRTGLRLAGSGGGRGTVCVGAPLSPRCPVGGALPFAAGFGHTGAAAANWIRQGGAGCALSITDESVGYAGRATGGMGPSGCDGFARSSD